MGKIRKQFSPEKHGATLSTFISKFISEAEDLPSYKLCRHLASFPRRWPFPRGDLYHWISVLNRFDEILEKFNQTYGLDQGPQTKPFGRTLLKGESKQLQEVGSKPEHHPNDSDLDACGYSEDGDKELAEGIIAFTRLLHENCGNRSLYASSGRLNDLLNTSSLSLLEKTLRLSHRLAQRYTASRLRTGGPSLHLGHISQSLLSTHFVINLQKLEVMTHPLYKVNKEAKMRMSGLLLGNKQSRNESDSSTPPAAPAVLSLMATSDFVASSEMETLADDSVSYRKSISDIQWVTQRVMEADSTKSDEYDAFHRVRMAYASLGSREDRIAIIAVRLLAIANLAQIYPEATLQEKALRSYSEKPRHLQLPQTLCELIRPPSSTASKIPRKISSLALLTLESLTSHKGLSNEVCTALNVSVNHGPLASALRQGVNLITESGADEYNEEETEWLAEMFALLHAIPKASGRAPDGLLSAGLIDMLLEILKAKTPRAEQRHAPALGFLSVFVYNTNDALGSLVNAGGLDVVSDLLVHEIDLALSLTKQGKGMLPEYRTQVTDYQIPFAQQQCLRAIFKFVYNMLGMSGGAFDRLMRNLIESGPVLNGLRTVISNNKLFGSNVWTNCVNVFSSFINNEPTSYNAIAEAGIPQAVLESITQRPIGREAEESSSVEDLYQPMQESGVGPRVTVRGTNSPDNSDQPAGGILSACEAVNAIPDAFGAMCLNESGMHQFEASGALDTLFEVFVSPSHVKAFSVSPGNDIERLGNSLEQLHRHNPNLAARINALVLHTATKVADLVHTAPLSGRVPDSSSKHVENNSTGRLSDDVDMEGVESSPVPNKHQAATASSTFASTYVGVFTKFLASLFRNTTFCSRFTEAGGLETLLIMACCPSLFRCADNTRIVGPLSCIKLADVLRHMAEQKPHLVLPPLIARIHSYLDSIQPLLDQPKESSYINPLVHSREGSELDAHEKHQREITVRHLVAITVLVEGLGKSLIPVGPNHPTRNAPLNHLAQVNVADMLCPVIRSLGRLQMKMLWEHQLSVEKMVTNHLNRTPSRSAATTQSSGNGIQQTSPPVESTLMNGSNQIISHAGPMREFPTDDTSYIVSNFQYLIPKTITDVLAKISNTIVPRRLPSDSYQKQQVSEVADYLAQYVMDLLSFEVPPSTDFSVTTAFRKNTLECIRGPLLGSANREYSQRSGSQLQTLVVMALLKKGGVKVVGERAKAAMRESIQSKRDDEVEQQFGTRRDEATLVLNQYISLLGALTDRKALHESAHTMALAPTRDRDPNRPDVFNSAQLLVELRLEVARGISGIWSSDDLHKLQGTTIKVLSKVIQNVLEGNGEHGAFSSGDRMPNRSKAEPKKWKVRDDQLQPLLETYPRDLCEEALYRCNGGLNSSREYCAYFDNWPGRGRYPPPAGDLQAPPSDADTEATPAVTNSEATGINRTADGWSQATDEPSGVDASQQDEDGFDARPTAFIDALSDVAQTILRDPTHAAYPTETSSSSSQGQQTSPGPPKTEEVSGVVTVNDLDHERALFRANLMDRCLSLAGAYDDVTFEMSDLITSSVAKAPEPAEMRREISATLVMSLVSYAGNDNLQAEGKKVSGIAHLLGIVLQDKDFFDAAQDELKESFSSLASLLPIASGLKPAEVAPWIPQILLILEHVLANDVQPHQIEWVPPSSTNPSQEQAAVQLPEPMTSKEDRGDLFNILLELLPSVGRELELGVSIVRVLVILTRNRGLATEMARKRNMQRFLLLVKQLAPTMSNRFRSSVLLILRHIVEDEDTIRRLIRSDIKELLDRPSRPVDTTRYTRDLYHTVLRAPELFIEVTNDMVELQKFDRNQSPQILVLKKTLKPVEKVSEERPNQPTDDEMKDRTSEITQPSSEKPDSDEKSKGHEIRPPTVEHPDGVIHFLLCELLMYKDVEDQKPSKDDKEKAGPQHNSDVEMAEAVQGGTPTAAAQSPQPPVPTSKPTTEKEQFKAEDHTIYIYRCFILTCLTELLASYNKTKIEFINFSRKADPQAATPPKPRSGVLNYLLNALLPTGSIEHASSLDAKKRASTSNTAIGAVVALCSRTTENGAMKHRDTLESEDEPELLFVRRFVLEHALKAYKDCLTSSDPVEARYSKLLALADFYNRVLAGRPSPSPGFRRGNPQDDNLVPTNKQIAKIMFEKNFIGALTSSMSDIDLKLLGANRVVKYVLRPLKLLTHTAIELSLSSDPSTSPSNTTDNDEISSATSGSDAEHDREETPDLYRHSTLGMFEPGREDEPSSSSDEEEEEGMYGDAYADDMEFDEEEQDADEGEVVSDEDEEMEGVGPMEGLSGDMGIDVEIDIGDEDSGTDDDEEDEDEDMEEASGDDDEDGLSEDEDIEDGDNDVEILDEITGDDGVDSMGEQEEEEGWDPAEGHPPQTMMDMLAGGVPPFAVDEDQSDQDVEHFSGSVMNAMDDAMAAHEHLEIDMGDGGEGDGAVDLESDDDDEDEEEYDMELMYREEGEDEDSEMPPYIFNPWPSTPGRRGNARPSLLARPEDFAFRPDSMLYGGDYRSHRQQGARSNEAIDGQNPLLNRSRRTTASGPATGHRVSGGGLHVPGMPSITSLLPRLEDLGPGSDPEHYHYLTSLINALGRGGPAAILPALHGHHHHHGGPIQFRIGSAPGGGPHDFMEIQIAQPPDLGVRDLPLPHQYQAASGNDTSQAVNFQPAMTTERWQEEARLIFGPLYYDKAVKVVNSILRLLVPPAMEAERIRKETAEGEAKKREEERLRVEKEKAEQEEKERKEREEREAREKSEMEEREAAAAAARGQESPETAPEEAGETMEGVESTAAPTTEASAVGPPAPAERVHTTIRGRQLDITDLGIDNDYLEALPEEMREEVIMQVYAEHRSEAAAAGTEPTSYQREFLDALPPDIREEILQQERADRRRREREEQRRRTAANAGQPAQAEEMDPASFIASLDAPLRQQVLADADDDMLASLPPDLAAEARALSGHHRRRALDPSRLMADIDHLTGMGGPSRERRQEILDRMGESRPQRRPIVQMLDKASVVTLLRLMFIPIQGNARQTLNGILRNACGNHQTRSEIVSGLLAVLQEGSVDQTAVERSFSQMTGRARQIGANKTPVKKTPSSEAVLHNEANPRLVIGNCLSSLIFLTQSITHIPKFFLSEHEVVGGPKSKSKGKGKARDTKASRIPLNALLTLLDREVVLDNSHLIEHLAGLLQSVTQPLPALLKKDKDEPKKEVTNDTPVKPQLADAAASTTSTVGNETVPAPAETQSEATGEETSAESVPATSKGTADQPEPEEVKSAIVDSKRPFTPPDIPEENLRLIINILTARDCGGKTFRDALSTINNLSMIPHARQIFGQELVKRARQLGRSIAADLAQLMKNLRGADDAMEAQNMALAKFSPTGSDQSKLNRILTALDYLFDARSAEEKDLMVDPNAHQANGLLTGLHEDPTFSKVWSELSATLSTAYETLAKGQQSDKTFLNVATILLPLIESLMVVCKRLDLKDARTHNSQKMSQPTTPALESTMKMIFFNFTNRHRKILNDLVRSNPKLMSGSFSVLVRNSPVLEFDNKRNYFTRRLHHRNMDMRQYPHPSLQLNVRRDQVFTDSYKSLYYKKPEEIKYGKLNIRFHNEEGVDAGGVTREWFQVLSRQMFDPNFALFNPVASDRTTFHPNPSSAVNEAHLQYFNFIGRIIGKALYENRVLDCHFSRAVYKRILGNQVSLKDMETIDLDYSKSLQWMLENDITDIITESFSVAEEEFGVTRTIDLIENGSNIPVTDENKHEYVRLVIEYKLTGSVKEQLENFLKGFHDIVPAELIAIFDEGELELLISGMPEIDIFDWKNNTDYHNYNVNSPQIQWLWRAVRSFDKEERAKLLQFVTGTSKVPLNGFKELEGMNGFTRFSIHKDYGNKDRLPSSHTCFNQLDLPEYDSYESLRKNLYTAMTTGGEYFGFA